MDIDDVRKVIEKEMNGPDSLLRYRALHQKIREVHGLRSRVLIEEIRQAGHTVDSGHLDV